MKLSKEVRSTMSYFLIYSPLDFSDGLFLFLNVNDRKW